MPGSSMRDYGKVRQYGPLLRLTCTDGQGIVQRYNDFSKVMKNPCKA